MSGTGTLISDDDLIEQLEDCTLPEDAFHHVDHLHAAWVYLNRYPALDAIGRFCRALRGYAGFLGKPERYHETVTWAYLQLLNERMRRSERAASWAEFIAAHPDLCGWRDSILLKYYTKEALDSELARQVFVMPDRLAPKLPLD